MDRLSCVPYVFDSLIFLLLTGQTVQLFFIYGCELYSPNISYATFPFFYKNLLHVDIIGERKKSKKILVAADARFYETIE